jgi:uncharacterized membrane protein
VRGHRDLRLAAAASVACALLALLAPFEALSLAFAAPLVFYLSGYAIVAVLFARRPIGALQRLTLSVGLSLAVIALGALILNHVPGGVSEGVWAIFLPLVVIAALMGAAIRRPAGKQWSPTWPRASRAQAAVLAGGAVAAILAVVLAFTPLPATHAIGYTELWMQPFSATGREGVRVGIGNAEQKRVGYGLEVRFARGGTAVRRFALDPGEHRVIRFLARHGHGRPQRVVAVLYRFRNPERPYRRVSGWTPGAQPGG